MRPSKLSDHTTTSAAFSHGLAQLQTLPTPVSHRWMETQSEVVQTATNQQGDKPQEGDRRWSLMRRADGFFTHYEEAYIDLYDHGGGVDGYWTRSHASGLFDDVEAAMEDALGSLTWLDERLSAG